MSLFFVTLQSMFLSLQTPWVYISKITLDKILILHDACIEGRDDVIKLFWPHHPPSLQILCLLPVPPLSPHITPLIKVSGLLQENRAGSQAAISIRRNHSLKPEKSQSWNSFQMSETGVNRKASFQCGRIGDRLHNKVLGLISEGWFQLYLAEHAPLQTAPSPPRHKLNHAVQKARYQQEQTQSVNATSHHYWKKTPSTYPFGQRVSRVIFKVCIFI